MIILDMEQRTEEWHDAHKGIPTASIASKLITAVKGDISSQSEALIDQCIAEGLGLDDDEDSYSSVHMNRGTEMESTSLAYFKVLTGLDVIVPGFVLNDEKTAGCSPDGLIVGTDGKPVAGLEMKNPMAKTHIGYQRQGALPTEYKQQCHMSMVITGLKLWKFYSHHPELSPFIIDVVWDEYTDKVADAVETFVAKLAMERERLGHHISGASE